MNQYLRAQKGDIRIGKVVGENEDGITLFIPKDTHGGFHLTEGERDTFLTLLFVKSDGRNGIMTWCPWADGPVIES